MHMVIIFHKSIYRANTSFIISSEPAFPQLARQISSGLKEQIYTASQEDENKSESFGEEEKGDERVHGESDISSGEERIVMPDSLFYEQAGGVTGLVNLGYFTNAHVGK